MKMDPKRVTADRIPFRTIKQFRDEYKIGYTVESVAYHITQNKIDWMKPGTDRFVLLTDRTLAFYDRQNF